ncbi:MAG: WbuC family cupin fold metalloprotein [Tannerella sp.]|nr:WbuC family cupin fold metalloprotein [Tannerella sp.]
MKIINEQLLDATTAQAQVAPRLRMNYNFHADLNDPLNRLLNAMEPGTYLRPHRHCRPDKHEIFLLLRGRVAVFLFDEEGHVTETVILDPRKGCYGGEIPAGTWHGLLVLESGSVIYEIKQGPFAPLTPENMAPWSPPAEDAEAARNYMENLKRIMNDEASDTSLFD